MHDAHLLAIYYMATDNNKPIMVLDKVTNTLYTGDDPEELFFEIEQGFLDNREEYHPAVFSRLMFYVYRNGETVTMNGVIHSENNEFPNLYTLESYHEALFGTTYSSRVEARKRLENKIPNNSVVKNCPF